MGAKRFLADVAVVSEWHPVKNIGVDLTFIPASSKQKVWWLGKECAHEWFAVVNDRVNRGTGCPFCTGKRLCAGFNDLATVFPDVAAEWDYNAEINEGVTPSNVLAGNAAKRGFVCPLGHSYIASLKSRCEGTGCNVCHGLVVLSGFNDLASSDPDVASKWDYSSSLNAGLSPETVTAKSNKKFGWLCDKGHSFVAGTYVMTRVDSRRMKCPVCSNKVVIQGVNDLATVRPDLATEWDFESEVNKGVSPDSVVAGGRRMVGWVCGSDHRWVAKLNNRVNQGQGCSRCALNQTSRVEGEFRGLFAKIFSNIKNPEVKIPVIGVSDRRKWLLVDILGEFRGQQVVVEYDGAYWHQGKNEHDVVKTQRLLDAGFVVVRIREQHRGLNLGFLPLSHESLLQVGFDSYLYDKVRLQSAVDTVIFWLDSL